MKRAIFTGVKIGAITGFVLAVLYAIVVLLVTEASLPLPNPHMIVIFTPDFFSVEFPFLVGTSPIWLMSPILIGGITTGSFGFIIAKSHPSRTYLLYVSAILCIIVASPLLLLFGVMTLGVLSGGAYHSILDPFLEIRLMLFFPSMIYVLTGIVTGQYLHMKLNNSQDANASPS